jgi:hypothetical protein
LTARFLWALCDVFINVNSLAFLHAQRLPLQVSFRLILRGSDESSFGFRRIYAQSKKVRLGSKRPIRQDAAFGPEWSMLRSRYTRRYPVMHDSGFNALTR